MKYKNSQKIKKDRGFVILFAVTISSILLAIALGVANIALKEVKFGTSAKDTNNAFFAADTGIEAVLLKDKPPANNYPPPITDGVQQTWTEFVSGLGSLGTSCARIDITKTNVLNSSNTTTTVISKGYNNASCTQGSNSIERELQVNY